MNTEVLNLLKKSSIYSGRYSLETFHFCTKSVRFTSFLLLHKFPSLSILFITGKGLCIQFMKVIIEKYVIKKVVILFSLLDFFFLLKLVTKWISLFLFKWPTFCITLSAGSSSFFPPRTMTIVSLLRLLL